MRSIITTMRGLDLRGPKSRQIVIDTEGAMLGPDCVLVRRTPEGYRCTTRDEAAAIQGFLRHGAEDPDWLFRQCSRIAKALADGHIALAQVYGLFFPTDGLDDGQLKQLALVAPFIKANFNPTSRAMRMAAGRTRAAPGARRHGGQPRQRVHNPAALLSIHEIPMPKKSRLQQIIDVKTKW